MFKYSILFLFAANACFSVESQTWGQWVKEKFFTSGEAIEIIIDAPIKVATDVKNYLEDHGAGKQAIKDNEEFKKLAQGSTAALDKLATGSEKSSEALKGVADATNKVADASKERNEILKEESNWSKTAKAIGIAGGIIYIGKSGHDFYKWLFPDEQAKLRKEHAAYQLQLLRATKAINECLARNMEAAKDTEGMPAPCKDASKVFTEVAGMAEYKKVRQAFIER